MSLRPVYLRLLLAVGLWGGMFAATRLTVREIPPLAASTLRFGVATLAFASALAAERRRAGPRVRRPLADAGNWPVLLALGATGVFMNSAALFGGLTLAPAVDAALLVPTGNPVATALLAALFLGEPITRRVAAGLGLAATGVLVVVLAGAARGAAGPGGPGLARLAGDGLFLVTVLGWSLYTVLARAVRARFTVLELTTGAGLTGTALLFLASLVEGGWGRFAAASAAAWGGLAYITLLGTVVAFVAWHEGVAEIGAARAAAFLNLVPIVGIAVSAAVLGERIGPWQLAGGGLVMAGVFLTTTGRGPGATGAPPAGPGTGRYFPFRLRT